MKKLISVSLACVALLSSAFITVAHADIRNDASGRFNGTPEVWDLPSSVQFALFFCFLGIFAVTGILLAAGAIRHACPRKKRKKEEALGNHALGITVYSISEYAEVAPNFAKSELEERVANLFVKLQKARQDRNTETLRPYLTGGFYEQINERFGSILKDAKTGKIETAPVRSVNVLAWYRERENDVLSARVKAGSPESVTEYECRLVRSVSKRDDKGGWLVSSIRIVF